MTQLKPLRIGILATHPIQYHAPLFRELAATPGVELTVFFCHRPTSREQGVGFGVDFEWDVDLLSGYRHVWLKNIARHPGVDRFFGCDTPEIGDILAKPFLVRGSSLPVEEKSENQEPRTRNQKPASSRPWDAFIVHGWAWKSCWQTFRACWRTGTPLVVRSDSQLPQGGGGKMRLKNAVKRLVYPRFIRRFDLCLAYGQRSSDYFHHYRARKVAIAPHFVDNDWFAARAAEFRRRRDELRQAWGIPSNAFCFLFCGKFIAKKRPLDILRALREVVLGSSFVVDEKNQQPRTNNQELRTTNQQTHNVHLLMVGDGELHKACEAYSREHKLPATFAGFLNQSEMPHAYAAADCLVLPSDYGETWGLVVNEAMACGLPAIVSDRVGCAADLILEGQTGQGVPCGDTAALADTMARLAADPTLAAKLGEKAREHIRGYSAQNHAKRLVKSIAETTRD